MKARILIIDDDDMLRQTLSRMLTAADYDVIEAPNGNEGLRQFGDTSVDLVITDILMPEKDGLETIRELRDADSDLKIIAVSGGDRTGNQMFLDMANAMGATGILAKPIRRQDLLDKVDAILAA